VGNALVQLGHVGRKPPDCDAPKSAWIDCSGPCDKSARHLNGRRSVYLRHIRPALGVKPEAQEDGAAQPGPIINRGAGRENCLHGTRRVTNQDDVAARALIALRLILAADCPKAIANKITDLCGVIYPDLRPK
jgi:hypothetical protein